MLCGKIGIFAGNALQVTVTSTGEDEVDEDS